MPFFLFKEILVKQFPLQWHDVCAASYLGLSCFTAYLSFIEMPMLLLPDINPLCIPCSMVLLKVGSPQPDAFLAWVVGQGVCVDGACTFIGSMRCRLQPTFSCVETHLHGKVNSQCGNSNSQLLHLPSRCASCPHLQLQHRWHSLWSQWLPSIKQCQISQHAMSLRKICHQYMYSKPLLDGILPITTHAHTIAWHPSHYYSCSHYSLACVHTASSLRIFSILNPLLPVDLHSICSERCQSWKAIFPDGQTQVMKFCFVVSTTKYFQDQQNLVSGNSNQR